MHWLKIIGGVVIGILILGGAVFFFLMRPAASIDVDNPPQFVQADFIDLSKIYSISKYRSGSGHDFAGNGETCRSMKHYFSQQASKSKSMEAFMQTPDPQTGVAIYSPVDGKITQMDQEKTPIGRQIFIRPIAQPSFRLRLFHVYPLDTIKVGSKVTAGQLIGYINEGQGTDIAVQASTLHGFKLVSYFQVMPDSVFAAYQARGLKTRDDVIITKAQRDAHPLACNGEQFAQNYDTDPNSGNEVRLSGYQAPDYSYERSLQQNKPDQTDASNKSGPQQ